jgi:hypothetical protein
MLPPPDKEEAPLKNWWTVSAHDTAKECEQKRSSAEWLDARWKDDRFKKARVAGKIYLGLCIASDDPRLK